MSATTEPLTLEGLRERLAEQEAEAAAAEEALGAATLDSPNPKAASRRLLDAQAAVQATKAALLELERRGQAEAERREALSVARGNHAIYTWIAEYMQRAAAVVERAAELEAAERRLADHRVSSRAMYRFREGLDRKLDHEVAFDAELVRRVPADKRGRWPATSAAGLERLAADDALRHRERALALADTEQQKLAELTS